MNSPTPKRSTSQSTSGTPARLLKLLLISFAISCSPILVADPGSQSDVITDWNAAFESTLAAPAERGPRVPVRTLAIMHAAMFDAANSARNKYEPIHVTDPAPNGVDAESAAIWAAYTVLSQLRSAYQGVWDAQLEASLSRFAGKRIKSRSIDNGREWGEFVANEIIAWRATDGSTTVLPPYVGDTGVGYWRHASLGTAANAGYVNTVTEPFLLEDPSEYDPGPPYGIANRETALASAAYAADVNDVQARGGQTSATRTAQNLDDALFNDACDVAGLNRMLRSLLDPKASLVDDARTFALFNMAAFDTTIVMFTAKYNHALWRPFQAIRNADLDDNAGTTQDAAWASYLGTPPHPEYPSAHVTLFSTLLQLAAEMVGDEGSVELTAAPSAAHAGGTRTYDSLAAISDLTVQSRVYIGYHYLQTGLISQELGRILGEDFNQDFLQPSKQN